MSINIEAEKRAYQHFVAAGMTPAGACGLIGNLEAESDGFWCNRLEYLCVKRLKERGKVYTDTSYTAAVDSGKISCEEFLHPIPGKQYGYGLAQWTTPARKSGLYTRVKQRGVSIADEDTQLDYVLYELEHVFPSVLKVLKTAASIRTASDIVLRKFEAPAGITEATCKSRAARGQKFYDHYVKGVAMTKQNAIDKLISVASAEVGYLEKKSNSQLDSKTANAGSNNYTKYARDYRTFAGVNYQGQAWCDMFVDWCFVQAFGKETARELLGGGFSAYTPTSAQYYKNKKQWHSAPQAGDQVFFHNSSRICHTGIVYRVSGNTVYTIEGNTSGASGVIANGGGVCKKSYALGNSRISGYGRPDWSLATGGAVDVPTTPKGDAVYMFSMKTVKRGETGTHVLLVQEILRARGYKGKDGKVLELDRSCGDNTVHAIKSYQADREKQSPGICGGVDGIAGEKTLRDLIAL